MHSIINDTDYFKAIKHSQIDEESDHYCTRFKDLGVNIEAQRWVVEVI